MNTFSNIIDKFLLSFSMKIEVHVAKDVFTFKSRKGRFDLKTRVYLERDGEHYKIASFSDESPDTFAVKKVELFSDKQNADYECLKQFIAYGISLTTSKYALIRPSIVCIGIENFADLFSGYQQGIFFNLFSEAGAASIAFIEP